MAVESYLPKTDLGRSTFLTQFAEALPEHAAILGIDAATVTFVKDSAKFFKYILKTNTAIKKQMNAWVAYKNGFIYKKIGSKVGNLPPLPDITPPAVIITEPIFAHISLLVGEIKSKETYKESIGKKLGIIGPEIVEPDLNTVQPQITVLSSAHEVFIKWKKARFTSIDIYLDRGNGAGFEYLDNSSRSPYKMPINLPQGTVTEKWTFRTIYRIADKQVGLFSNPVFIYVHSAL